MAKLLPEGIEKRGGLNRSPQKEKPYIKPVGQDGMTDSGKRMVFGKGKALREPSTGKGRYDLVSPFFIDRIAKWMEKGAIKYYDRNWEKGGIPFHRFVDSGLRHLYKFLAGYGDEDHLAGVAFNIMALMHFEELNQLEDDDLPHYLRKKDDKQSRNKSRKRKQ
jgi:hypothetical protein